MCFPMGANAPGMPQFFTDDDGMADNYRAKPKRPDQMSQNRVGNEKQRGTVNPRPKTPGQYKVQDPMDRFRNMDTRKMGSNKRSLLGSRGDKGGSGGKRKKSILG